MYKITFTEPGQSEGRELTGSRCADFIDGTLAWLDKQPAGLVIMGATDVSWWSPTDLLESEDKTVPLGSNEAKRKFVDELADNKQAGILEGMTSTAQFLRLAGHDVVIAQAPPSYRFPSPSWMPSTCSVTVLIADECNTSVPVREIDKVQHRTREVVLEAAMRTGAGVLDLRSYLCPDGVCVTEVDDVPMYLDDIHLSVLGSESLAPWFTQFVQARD